MGFLSALNLGGNSYKLKPGNFYECRSMEQWNALTQEQQDEYDYVLITGDEEEQDLTNAYLTTDSAVSTIAQGDYIPILKTDNSKKKVLWSTIIAKIKSALGTAAAKNSTNEVTSGSTDLVESGAVYTEIQTLTNNDDAMLNVLGAKNLLQNNMPITQVDHLVTLTVNSDNSVSTNGTSDGNVGIKVNGDIPIDLPSGRYVLSGCPVGGTVETYYLALFNGNTLLGYDEGDGLEFEKTNQTDLKVYITIKSGVTAPNNNWYPMIRPATVTDDTYVPYAKTNKELTDGRLRYVDYTIPSNTYNPNAYSGKEGTKSTVFGIPNEAKIVSVTLMGNNYYVIVVGWNDFTSSNYLRIFLYNKGTSAVTTALPVRIFYEL